MYWKIIKLGRKGAEKIGRDDRRNSRGELFASIRVGGASAGGDAYVAVDDGRFAGI